MDDILIFILFLYITIWLSITDLFLPEATDSNKELTCMIFKIKGS